MVRSFLVFFIDSTGQSFDYEIKDADEWGNDILRIEKGYVFADIVPHNDGWVATMFIHKQGFGRHEPPRNDPVNDEVETTIIGAIGWALEQFYHHRIHTVMQDFQAVPPEYR